jgi:hypothetical protein
MQYEPGTYVIMANVTDGIDTLSVTWQTDIITSVELTTFAAQFSGFEGVEVSWETSREIDNAGFNVLRSLSENGTFEKINDELIASDEEGSYKLIDKDVEAGTRYYYKLEDIDINGVVFEHEAISIDISVPETFELSQNYPNPFNPETKIRYQLPQTTDVLIRIYDVLGRTVRTMVNEKIDAGYHIITWDATNDAGVRISSGVYYYRIVAGEYTITKKMLLLK